MYNDGYVMIDATEPCLLSAYDFGGYSNHIGETYLGMTMYKLSYSNCMSY
jgi:hypothetical protein